MYNVDDDDGEWRQKRMKMNEFFFGRIVAVVVVPVYFCEYK